MRQYQQTLSEKVTFSGVGVHSGETMTVEVLPAPPDHGVTFCRTDGAAPLVEIAVHPDLVTNTTLATTISANKNGSSIEISTVEHLMAALYGVGIDNARVLVDGPELPILDGSAKPFAQAFLERGLDTQNLPARYLWVRKEITVEDGDKRASVMPSSGFRITCKVDFSHPLIPDVPYSFNHSPERFVRDIAGARTFGFLKDVEALRARGLARGGSLDNAVVIDGYKVLNPEGLRYSDEFVRHKVLDVIGDLALVGMPIRGKFSLTCPGHTLNHKLVRALLADPAAYEMRSAKPAEPQPDRRPAALHVARHPA